MRIYLLLLFCFTLTSSSFAMVITETKIHEIIYTDANENYHLVLTKSGDVYELDKSNQELLGTIYNALLGDLLIKIQVTDSYINDLIQKREQILDIKLISYNYGQDKVTIKREIPTPIDDFEVSSVSSMTIAESLFQTQNPNTRWRSQCYNRAHVWAYELSKNNSINIGKVWMFFTRRYIKEYRYKWWFHVTPFIYSNDTEEEVILDREFTRNPKSLTDWKNIFIRNQEPCPVVEYYSDYKDNQWSNYCYHIKSSMFYWQPYNIENLEKGDAEKKNWIDSELRRAYSNAIKY
jgi:hypothetical protein